jgi:hypothetical protein
MESYKIIDRYNNQKHVRGSVDCQLLILEIFEPEMHDAFINRYKTLVGAVRVAKKIFGVISLEEYLSTSEKYKIIESNFQQPLDIVVFHDRHDSYISLGDYWFGVNSNDTFTMQSKSGYDKNDYKIFRRI